MWNISAEPMPSRISTPKRLLPAPVELGRQRLAGGEHEAQRREVARRPRPGWFSIPPIIVGTDVRIVGR